MKFFIPKKAKISNFELKTDIYLKRKLRACTIKIQPEKVIFLTKKIKTKFFSFFT